MMSFSELYKEIKALVPKDQSFSVDVSAWCHRRHVWGDLDNEPITFSVYLASSDSGPAFSGEAGTPEQLLSAVRAHFGIPTLRPDEVRL